MFSEPEHAPPCLRRARGPCGPGGRRDREQGIALLVVMVAFVILYLVVYQLHFSTGMEEKIAKARYSQVESATALQSVALYVLTLLIEDLTQDMTGGSSTSAVGASAGTGTPGVSPTAEGGGGAQGTFTPLTSTGGGGKWFDYINERIFSDNQQSVGETTVKITIVDCERCFDLNQIFDYIRLEDEEIAAGTEDLREEDLIELAGQDEKTAEKSLAEKIRLRIDGRRAKKSGGSAAAASGGEMPTELSGGVGDFESADEALSEYEPDPPFTQPDERRIAAARQMVERAVLMMFSINENVYGYRYQVKYSAGEVANAIIDYILARRMAPYQNRIYLVTELLNIPGVTREVFYGPMPEVREGEEVPMANNFVLRKDEFGDTVPVYVPFEEDPFLDEEKRQIEELQSQFGQFADFGGMGFSSLLSNALTRGMTEQPVEMDEYGYEYVVETPRPIGLKDIFTTHSSGKININTASVPVLFGLLSSLTDEEAEIVALNIRDYRNKFQEELPEEGLEMVGESQAPDLGQPKRKPRSKEEEEAAAAMTSGVQGTDLSGLDPYSLEPTAAGYENLETNYFTNLQQLELIDGSDGGPEDLLRKDEGVQRVSAETDTLYHRVIHDLEKTAVFGSTYFTAELKGKTKSGRGKTGFLTVRRDAKKKLIEVLMWKNLQK